LCHQVEPVCSLAASLVLVLDAGDLSSSEVIIHGHASAAELLLRLSDLKSTISYSPQL